MTAGCIDRSGEGAVAEVGRWSRCAGFKRSIETVSERPLRSIVKNLVFCLSTLFIIPRMLTELSHIAL